MKDEFTNKYPFKLGVIKDRGGDLKKRWYVEFYVWDLALNRLTRLMEYANINRLKDAKARLNQALIIKKEIDKKLVTGEFCINSSDLIEPEKVSKSRFTVKSAFEHGLEIKAGQNADSTTSNYKSIKKVFFEYLDKKKLGKLPIEKLNKKHFNEFFNYLLLERNIENTSINNFRCTLISILNLLVDEQVIKENPCKHIKKLKTTEKTHYPYTDEQAQVIKGHLLKTDSQMWLFCSFIYYLFARPNELRFTQIKAIDLKERRMLIPAYITFKGRKIRVSKNRKSEYVKIPVPFVKVLETMNLDQYPPDYFLFGYNGVPGEQYYSSSVFTHRYTDLTKVLNKSIDQTLYSWKHTGVCKLYKAIKDIKHVQQQCRHSSIAVTSIYLRNLGLFDNKEVEEHFPEV